METAGADIWGQELSIVKDAVFDKFWFLRCLGILLPSVMKPARDLENGDYFVVVIIKNLILNRKKFS